MKSSKFETIGLVCKSALIVDLEAKTAHPYDQLDVKIETPGLYYPARHAANRIYLIVWPSGVVAQLVTRLALEQLQPSTIETLFEQATHVKPNQPHAHRSTGGNT